MTNSEHIYGRNQNREQLGIYQVRLQELLRQP